MKINDLHLLLIWKESKGELAPDEAAQLGAWLAESPENAREAAHIRQIWDKTGDSSAAAAAFVGLDLDAEFARLQTKIGAEKPAARVVQMWPRQLVRAAAAIAILLAAMWGLRQFSAEKVAETIALADGATREIALPDGSQVWLRAGAELKFPTVFSKNERAVRLSGEAFFQVVHNAAQPFRVETPDGSTVQVLGTEFNVRALGNEPRTEVFVKSGKVRFQNAAQSVVLMANQRGVFSRSTGQMQAAIAPTANDLAWQAGGLSFVQTPLHQVVADFEKYYGAKIALENAALRDCPYTSPLANLPLEKSLAALAVAFQLEALKISEQEFLLRGGSCR